MKYHESIEYEKREQLAQGAELQDVEADVIQTEHDTAVEQIKETMEDEPEETNEEAEQEAPMYGML
mgnify:CR=1 FL=1